jgi:hypothetical protein
MAQLEEMETLQEESSEQHFQFVDVIAGSTGKTKAAQRRVVRSNAARYQWSQTKSNSKATTKPISKTARKPKDTASAKDENVLKAHQVTGSQTLLDQSASLSKVWLSLPGEDDCDLLKFSKPHLPPLPSILLNTHRLRHHSPRSPPTPPQRRREPSRCQMDPTRLFQSNSLPDMDEMWRHSPESFERRIAFGFA